MQLFGYLLKKRINLVLATGFFLGGLVSGLFLEKYWAAIDDAPKPRSYEIRQKGYKFTNPLLECEIAKDTIGDREIRPFREKIESLITSEINSNRASFISVYFRDLNNGPWFGINEKEYFAPASLLKVPVMITYFKLAETNPELLNKKLIYKGGEDKNTLEHFKPPVSLNPGQAYKVEELIYRMIAYSDNNAKDILLANLNPTILAKTHLDMGVRIPRSQTPKDFLPVKSYASFFRVLFNASYLNRDFSEKALQYLSESTFKRGLASGIPESIPIAHKFGEHAENDAPQIKQLHDCGIIYYPDSPYLLCLMTRGNNVEILAETMGKISALIFNELSIQEKTQDNVPSLTMDGLPDLEEEKTGKK